MSNRIEDLEPGTRAKCDEFLRRTTFAGFKLKITHTLRTYEEQDALYAQGRTAPGAKVTNARGGESWHNFGRAFDIAEADASPYDLGQPGLKDDDALWEAIGRIGEECGLDWGGRWKHPDRPHFEDRGGMTLAQARAQYEAGRR